MMATARLAGELRDRTAPGNKCSAKPKERRTMQHCECVQCGKSVPFGESFSIDGRNLCHECVNAGAADSDEFSRGSRRPER